MSRVTGIGGISLLFLALSLAAPGPMSAGLQTSDTKLALEAGPTAPRLISLAVPGQAEWENRASEVLIPSAEVSGKETPLHWTFNRESSQIGDERVAFVYDCPSPHLRLTW